MKYRLAIFLGFSLLIGCGSDPATEEQKNKPIESSVSVNLDNGKSIQLDPKILKSNKVETPNQGSLFGEPNVKKMDSGSAKLRIEQ